MKLLIVLLIAVWSVPGYSKEALKSFVLVFNPAIKSLNVQSFPVYQLVSAALAEHGYQLDPYYLPGKRAMAEVAKANADGVFALTVVTGIKYSHLQRVDEALYEMGFYRYVRNDDDLLQSICKQKLGALRGQDRLINAVRTQMNCVHSPSTIFVDKPEQLIAMLKAERIDSISISSVHGRMFRHYYGNQLVREQVPLFRIKVYMHLSDRHSALAKSLAVTLRRHKAMSNYPATIEEQMQQMGWDPTFNNETTKGKSGL